MTLAQAPDFHKLSADREQKFFTVARLTALVTIAQADIPSDLVTSIPGFQATDFKT